MASDEAVAWAEELAAEAMAKKEMSKDRVRWDEDMATARHSREIHELIAKCRHRVRLARCYVAHVSDRR
jgi:hypothetical protein